MTKSGKLKKKKKKRKSIFNFKTKKKTPEIMIVYMFKKNPVI